jgi:hypothetical protein
VVPPQPVLRPARVFLDEVTQRVAGFAGLPHRLDLVLAATADLSPTLAVVPDFAAFDLEADDAGAFDGDHEVDLVVLEMVSDALARHDEIVRFELSDQCLVSAALRRVEPWSLAGRDAQCAVPSPVG